MNLSPAAAAARKAVSTPLYGLVYLALADLAYTDEKHDCESKVTADLQNAVAKLPPLPAPTGSVPDTVPGSWKVTWGPVYTQDYSNLMYAATYTDADSGLPIFGVVSIRGTDTSAGMYGLLQQLLEDTADLRMVRWDDAVVGKCGLIDTGIFPGQERIAAGTCRGLQTLTQLQQSPGGENILMHLQNGLLSQDPQMPIVVTGHSLGGCQVTVLAPYLATNLPAGTVILPNPFAPPSAGNAAFALNAFDLAFPGANVWWNTLDLVPQAYASIGDINSLWNHYQWPDGTPGPALPDDRVLSKIVNDLAAWLKIAMYHYTQPTTGNIALRGSLPSPETMQQFLQGSGSTEAWNSWPAQLLWQHMPPNYHALISNQFDAATVARYPLPVIPSC